MMVRARGGGDEAAVSFRCLRSDESLGEALVAMQVQSVSIGRQVETRTIRGVWA